MEFLEDGIGWVAAGFTLLSFSYPVFPYFQAIQGKLSFEDTPLVLVTTAYVNYYCWYAYGDMIFSYQMKYCYLIGTIIDLFLLVIYLAFEIRGSLVDSILNTLILIVGTWALYRALYIIVDDDSIVGKICIGTAFVLYFSYIQTIYKVITEKNYRLISIYNSLIIFISSILWVVYGILISDIYVSIPYSVAIIISMIEMIIYLNYRKKYPLVNDRDFTSTIGTETDQEKINKEDVTIKGEDEKLKGKEKPVEIATNN